MQTCSRKFLKSLAVVLKHTQKDPCTIISACTYPVESAITLLRCIVLCLSGDEAFQLDKLRRGRIGMNEDLSFLAYEILLNFK